MRESCLHWNVFESPSGVQCTKPLEFIDAIIIYSIFRFSLLVLFTYILDFLGGARTITKMFKTNSCVNCTLIGQHAHSTFCTLYKVGMEITPDI